MNIGVRSPADLFSLDEEKIKTLDKFKDKKASKLVDAIKKSKGVKLANFIYALGIDNVGSVTAKERRNSAVWTHCARRQRNSFWK